jgi:hypothetical protein
MPTITEVREIAPAVRSWVRERIFIVNVLLKIGVTSETVFLRKFPQVVSLEKLGFLSHLPQSRETHIRHKLGGLNIQLS